MLVLNPSDKITLSQVEDEELGQSSK